MSGWVQQMVLTSRNHMNFINGLIADEGQISANSVGDLDHSSKISARSPQPAAAVEEKCMTPTGPSLQR